jgi:hypothetical protein
MTGLNTEPKVVGRGQESRETERESVWETEHCWKQEMAWGINLIVGENIYGTCGRIICPLMIVFPWSEYFLC